MRHWEARAIEAPCSIVRDVKPKLVAGALVPVLGSSTTQVLGFQSLVKQNILIRRDVIVVIQVEHMQLPTEKDERDRQHTSRIYNVGQGASS